MADREGRNQKAQRGGPVETDLLFKTRKPPADIVPWETLEETSFTTIIRKVLVRGALALLRSPGKVVFCRPVLMEGVIVSDLVLLVAKVLPSSSI